MGDTLTMHLGKRNKSHRSDQRSGLMTWWQNWAPLSPPTWNCVFFFCRPAVVVCVIISNRLLLARTEEERTATNRNPFQEENPSTGVYCSLSDNTFSHPFLRQSLTFQNRMINVELFYYYQNVGEVLFSAFFKEAQAKWHFIRPKCSEFLLRST